MNRNIERKVVRQPPAKKKAPIPKKPTQVPKFVPPTFPKTLNTYIGPKGYTIYKHELTPDQLTSLCKMLIAKPVTPGVAFGPTVNNDFLFIVNQPKKCMFLAILENVNLDSPKRCRLRQVMKLQYLFKEN